jgi:hypothetical protein
MPQVLRNMDSDGHLKGLDGKVLAPGVTSGNYGLDFMLIYDGADALNLAQNMLLGSRNKPIAEMKGVDYKTLKSFLLTNNLDDKVMILDSDNGVLNVYKCSLKNSYVVDGKELDASELREKGLPANFKSRDGSVAYDDGHSRIDTALEVSAAHPVNVVTIPASNYDLGPKPVKFSGGRVSAEYFASYDPATRMVTMTNRVYDKNMDGSEKTADYGKFVPSRVSKIKDYFKRMLPSKSYITSQAA